MSTNRRNQRLAMVLRVRKVQEDRAAAELARAAQEVQARESALSASRALLASRPANRTIVDLAFDTVDRRTEALVQAESQEAGSRQVWTEAARRVKGLERLAERRRAEDDLEAKRRAEAVLDDITMTRVIRKQATS